jgi:hypothetical protein
MPWWHPIRPVALRTANGRGINDAVRVIHTCRMGKYLCAAQVAELAELLEDAPNRVGVVDEVLQSAAEGRG